MIKKNNIQKLLAISTVILIFSLSLFFFFTNQNEKWKQTTTRNVFYVNTPFGEYLNNSNTITLHKLNTQQETYIVNYLTTFDEIKSKTFYERSPHFHVFFTNHTNNMILKQLVITHSYNLFGFDYYIFETEQWELYIPNIDLYGSD